MYKRNLRVRKQNRLDGFDYGTPSLYFVTICTKEKFELLGTISSGVMCFSEIGLATKNAISKVSQIYTKVEICKNIVMPNHVHLIIKISDSKTTTPTVPQIVGHLKRAILLNLDFPHGKNLTTTHYKRR